MFVDVLLYGVSAEMESYILGCQRRWNHTLKLKKKVCLSIDKVIVPKDYMICAYSFVVMHVVTHEMQNILT